MSGSSQARKTVFEFLYVSINRYRIDSQKGEVGEKKKLECIVLSVYIRALFENELTYDT